MGLDLRSMRGTFHLATMPSMATKLVFIVLTTPSTLRICSMASEMKSSMGVLEEDLPPLTSSDFHVRDVIPLSTTRSNSARYGSTRGFSTGSSRSRMELCALTIRSKLPVRFRNISVDRNISIACCGTDKFSNKKYLASRSSRTRAGSKLVKSLRLDPFRCSRGRVSLFPDADSTSCLHCSIFCASNSASDAISTSWVLNTSLASSRSNRPASKWRSLVIGSSALSTRPRHHDNAREMGGSRLRFASQPIPIPIPIPRSLPLASLSTNC
mmetsp:Transcript_31989/g.94128  ORF Transcript_31989/g.94128 Transcript_31989/m.94128 type:complete len:269 (+) Transcript_31989:1068-1874(+)